MSTMRMASSRGFGGSTPNSFGSSPFSTQRQNLRSAARRSGQLPLNAEVVLFGKPTVGPDSPATALEANGPVTGALLGPRQPP